MAQTNGPKARPDDLLDYEELAEYLGIGIESARAYQSRAVQHRKMAARTGDPSHIRPGDLPEPDRYAGQSPLWFRSTIDRWNANRPGRGNVTSPVPVVRARQLASV
jgi:hypothetical protein